MKNGEQTKAASIEAISGQNIIHLPNITVQGNSTASFGEVIKKYRQQNNLSQSDLAGIMKTSRNTVVNWENGKAKPSIESITTLCLLLGIPLYELFGISNVEVPSRHENALLNSYRKLSDISRKMIDRMVSTMLQEEMDARDQYLRSTYIILPLEGTPAAAGTGCSFNDLKPEPLFIKRSRFSEAADAIVRVSGPSMEPLYHDNDLVYVQFTEEAEDGTDVICSTADGAVIKRARNKTLYSLNQNYPYGQKNEDDHVVVLGKVLGIVNTDDQPNTEDIADLENVLSRELRKFYEEYGD
jgi:transcriptional regulator with XRE-family HTH domain